MKHMYITKTYSQVGKNNIRGQQKININQINTTSMSEASGPRTYLRSLPLEQKGNPQLEPIQKTDLKKISQKKTTGPTVHKNGARSDLPTSSQKGNQKHLDEPDLYYLKRQIDQLETNDYLEVKLRYQSEVFVLKKRRKNLFRTFQKAIGDEKAYQRQDRAITLDNYINSKKPANKNSIKIQKFMMDFLSRRYNEPENLQILEFISNKHKIPLQISKKAVNIQYGYKQADIRKIKKYQINICKMPPLGYSFQSEYKKQQPEIEEDNNKTAPATSAEIYEDQVDCFDTIPYLNGYVLPQKALTVQLSENKRQIFKISRQMTRSKLERESILKKLAYLCMKEVQKKYFRCIRNQNDNVNRAKKLHRQCLVYWRKREKELTELKKKKQKLQAQLKKRDEEEQQAKKQEKRLSYIMYQSDLYSHFMATKLGVEGEQKKEMQKFQGMNEKPQDFDEEAARLSVNQIINNKMSNLEEFDKNKNGQKLDLSTVDQGRLELVGTPSSFHGTLKEYQVKGLRWLNNLFEQGINGILADQMGLGKTIQAIALLSHISQNKNVWGPFLIVAPNSTLYNWQQQFKKFCPSLKVLPYWGNIKQRKTIRKFFSSKKFTQKPDSPFHVVITSYQLTVTDQKTFKRLKWQFMILDEAQAIKNILSQRWNTLKEFQARNRLLLTGTPIQNNMAELWALLNFVMPDLFDSHELFNQWFSKDIEAHSQDQKELDQIKIQKLHSILKPFMLRRIKKDVEHQIGKKHEHQILCEMTKRQKLLYDSIKERLNVKQLFKMFESKAKVQNLMNLVMQLRKVCNHPQLFERRPARSPFLFQEVYYYTGYIPIRAGEIKLISFNAKNPISYDLPILVYDQLMRYQEKQSDKCKRLANIYSVANQMNNPTFSALSLTNFTMSEIQFCFREDLLLTGILLIHWWHRSNYSRTFSTNQKLHINKELTTHVDYRFKLTSYNQIRSLHNIYISDVTAPPIKPTISSRSFHEEMELQQNNKFQKFIFQGRYNKKFNEYSTQIAEEGDWRGIFYKQPSLTKVEVIDFGNLIADSSKLKELDRILKQKKKNDDKVLIFCQMTKMIDILEDFMNLRKYTFFRLDGASNIADRRDMVNDFQKPTSKIFVFLLSTRAGGLGVTLTAANTVIFYDNDWNPTMDAQATDRAHRIGQSRDVNVYQLVTKGTIEERIVKRAQQKKTVQNTVYEGASFNFFKKDMILELMVDEFDAGGSNGVPIQANKKDGKEAAKKKGLKQVKGKQEQRQKPQKSQILNQPVPQ